MHTYQKTLKKKNPPSSKTGIWKRNQGQCEFLAAFPGPDIKFFLDLRAEFLFSSSPGLLWGNCSQLNIIFRRSSHTFLAMKSSGIPEIFQYFSNLIGNLHQTDSLGHKMVIQMCVFDMTNFHTVNASLIC